MPGPDPAAPALVVVDVFVDAPAERVFEALVQWSEQQRWMLGTRVEVRAGDGRGRGSELAAWTGIGRIGIWDTMLITRWEPPHRVDVLHTGRRVRGTGSMEVVALPGGRSRFVWRESIDLPLGRLGRIGWPLARPAVRAAVRKSLVDFGRLVERGVLPV
jgi:Polyketide cyclase / dehydrase and lipid transport